MQTWQCKVKGWTGRLIKVFFKQNNSTILWFYLNTNANCHFSRWCGGDMLGREKVTARRGEVTAERGEVTAERGKLPPTPGPGGASSGQQGAASAPLPSVFPKRLHPSQVLLKYS